MNETNDLLNSKRFRVKVGLAEYTLTCDSPIDAVRLARSELRRELPLMTEVINGIADKEFRVDQIG
jgi:hypothetical protein